MKVNYYVDDYGVLKIYKDNVLLVELSECEKMSEEQIKHLIQNYLEEVEMGLFNEN